MDKNALGIWSFSFLCENVQDIFLVLLFCYLHVVVISVLVISMFSFFLMSLFWKEWRSTENKYSLIEYVSPFSHCSAFMLTCALIPTLSLYSFFFFFTPVSLKCNPRLLQYNRYHLTYMGREIFLSFPLCLVSLSYKSSFFPPYTPPNHLCFSMVWWQGASLLGRWGSNQSGLPRGASDRRAQLPNCPQAGRPAGSAAATHVHRGTSSAVLAGLLSVWITFLDRWTPGWTSRKGVDHMERPLDVTGKCFFKHVLKWLGTALHSSSVGLCLSVNLALWHSDFQKTKYLILILIFYKYHCYLKDS